VVEELQKDLRKVYDIDDFVSELGLVRSEPLKSAPPIPSVLQEKLTAIDNEVVLLHFKWTYAAIRQKETLGRY
jgi:hypothetical protein